MWTKTADESVGQRNTMVVTSRHRCDAQGPSRYQYETCIVLTSQLKRAEIMDK